MILNKVLNITQNILFEWAVYSPVGLWHSIFAFMKFLMFLGSCFISSLFVQGQEAELWALYPESKKADRTGGSVILEYPMHLELVDSLYVAQMKKHPELNGFRIMVFRESGANSRTIARRFMLEFSGSNPEIPVYLKWQSPHWEVRCGNYRSRLEASKTLMAIRKRYPGAFITRDKIDSPIYLDLKTKED
ncbi:MAG TPA: hypothetical protein DDX92_06700 [Flavobacteriales bacterium]|jgi:hypothetical protein|nr:hypothetical protein [Flavobacteriales bacterium]